jgi:hypothetical protein
MLTDVTGYGPLMAPPAAQQEGTDMPRPMDVLTVSFCDPGGDPARGCDRQVRGTVNHAQNTITYELPDRTRATLDVVTARALQMILWEAVFGSLHPSGPFLQVEKTLEGGDPAV